MTTEEWIAKQRAKLEQLRTKNEPLRIAALTTAAIQANRIFVKGESSSGSSIGQYNSTTPFYINPNKAPRKTPIRAKGVKGLPIAGKHGEAVFKNGKNHVTSYQKSYKDFKANIGQKNDRVNLHLSGDMESDFRNAQIDSKEVNLKKVSVNEYQTVMKRENNIKVMAGNQAHFGVKVTDLTKSERQLFLKTVDYEFKKLMTS